MKPVVRATDSTAHGAPLGPGPGSADVFIGDLPAWRALPAGAVADALDGLAENMQALMSAPMLTPGDAAGRLGSISGLTQQAGAAAAADNPAAAGAVASATGALHGANAALSTAYASASAAPGGQPAATKAYTDGIKMAAAAAAGAVFQALTGAADTHACPAPCPGPPHGPGVVTRGSPTVFLNDLPAVGQGHSVVEAAGGSDAIVGGCQTVLVGD